MTSVSIIIPAWNEEKTLKATVLALLDIEYDQRKCEIIVVAGGDDSTYEIAQKLTAIMEVFSRYVVIPQGSHGKNAAIQLGIEEAENDMIVLLDADTIVSERWLRCMVKPIEDGACDLTIANSEPIRQSWVADFFMITKTYLLDRITWYPGHSIAFKATTVEKQLEYFFDRGTKVGVDYLLEKRFVAQGRKIMFAEQAVVKTHLPLSLKYFILTELRWLGALINIDGVSYRTLVCNSAVVGALISVLPLFDGIFILSFVFHTIYICKRIYIFVVAARHYKTNMRNVFGFVLLSYLYHIISFVCHIEHFLRVGKESHLHQGQRY